MCPLGEGETQLCSGLMPTPTHLPSEAPPPPPTPGGNNVDGSVPFSLYHVTHPSSLLPSPFFSGMNIVITTCVHTQI